MEKYDIELMMRINRLLLAQSYEMANSKTEPGLLAIGGLVAGATLMASLIFLAKLLGC